jgi:hypothetical protein
MSIPLRLRHRQTKHHHLFKKRFRLRAKALFSFLWRHEDRDGLALMTAVDAEVTIHRDDRARGELLTQADQAQIPHDRANPLRPERSGGPSKSSRQTHERLGFRLPRLLKRLPHQTAFGTPCCPRLFLHPKGQIVRQPDAQDRAHPPSMYAVVRSIKRCLLQTK